MIGIFTGLIKILGGTDGTVIGNSGDRLKVDTLTTSSGFANTWSSKLRYEDMNAGTGGVARNTGINTDWVQVYSYTGGAGFLGGMILNIETKDKWYIRLQIDGEELFGASGIFSEDLHNDAVYDVDDSGKTLNEMEIELGLMFGSHDRFIWTPPNTQVLRFASSVKVYVKRTVADAKRFRAGLMIIQKGV